MSALTETLARSRLDHADLVALLSLEDPGELAQLYAAARSVTRREVGPQIYLRGLVEISNVCRCDCRYCGIRRSNRRVERYTLGEEEILAAVRLAWERGFGSVVLQGGERADSAFVGLVERVVAAARRLSGGRLGITLSLGEQSAATLRRWRAAGARRYLLRIETSARELFAALHPAGQDLDARLRCLAELRRCGYQVGSGVMVGLPGQSLADLARDVLFLRDQDVDMVGMGPFIPHRDTPLAGELITFPARRERQLELGLKMIACVRLALRDVNIAATTALQALAADGRERGLRAGANVLMPNLTDPRQRHRYQLYEGKPGLDESSEASCRALAGAVTAAGASIAYHRLGTSVHYRRRVGSKSG